MLSGEIHLYEIVDRLYQKFGIYDGEMEEFPTMSDVLEYVENQYVRPHTEEARAQLLEYRDWFDIPENRMKIKSLVGMEIYRPRLMVIIGRASQFQDEIERQKLRDRDKDIEIVTYDDILRYAQQRRVIIEGLA
jgi:hypothetical protein